MAPYTAIWPAASACWAMSIKVRYTPWRAISTGTAQIIPDNILEKAPSAELRPGQKDSDSLPDYDILDKILYQYIERRQGPKEIIAMGIDEALVAVF